jgi:hypothetical protein
MNCFLLKCICVTGLAATWVDAANDTSAEVLPVKFSEVSRKIASGKDHKITLIRVRAPIFPKPKPAPVVPLKPEEQATADRLAQKNYVILNLTATVYLGTHPVTEIRWRDETGATEYRAWSNADFRYLAVLLRIETETTVYDWQPLLMVEAYAPTDFPAGQKPPIPENLTFSTAHVEYVLDSSAPNMESEETILTGLDTLHAYYQLHYGELKTAYEKRLADARAEEIRLARNPPKTPDTTTYFWPIQSRRNPR